MMLPKTMNQHCISITNSNNNKGCQISGLVFNKINVSEDDIKECQISALLSNRLAMPEEDDGKEY